MIFHLPSFLLLIGFPIFWLELYFFRAKNGQCTLTAFLLALFAFIYILKRERAWIRDRWSLLIIDARRMSLSSKIIFSLAFLGAAMIALIALWASALPPHTLPEADILNYHYTLPRQHLILGSFAHLPWSTADLWMFPLQFGLSPYWFATSLPNKLPQYFFSVCLWAVTFRLAYRLTLDPAKKLTAGALASLAVVGSHGFGVQYGTGMMDIPIAFLLIAAIDSFLDRRYALCGAEIAFYMWAKSFLPVQVTIVFTLCVLSVWAARKAGLTISWTLGAGRKFDSTGWLRTAGWAALFSVFVGFPFMFKSLYYAGTPAYPAAVGLVPIQSPATKDRQAGLEARAAEMKEGAQSGGAPRSWRGFITHFWWLSVPTRGVNNDFDYPAGLPLLLFLGPFVIGVVQAFGQKRLSLLALLTVFFWTFWWFSAHHTRFLYVPLALLFIAAVSQEALRLSKGFAIGIMLGVFLTMLSVFRSHQGDLGKSRWETVRSQDKDLIRLGETLGEVTAPVAWSGKEAAYATFPILIKKGDSFILE